VRVYLPLTLTGLAELHAGGSLGPAPLAAHAVTDRLRRDWPTGDDEELEYAALMAAAFDSLVAIDATGAAPRRVVVAAEVDDADVQVGDDETAVQVAAGVPLGRCQAVHVDDADAEADVRAALAQLPAALAGDGPALGAVALTDHELLWFATQEIPDLL
jgi:hypothetical protein